jgi:glycosyltransferase involved in cell wall biosynthesis
MKQPKLSMVIPTYTLTKELERLAIIAADSYRDHVDELIIIEDGGVYSPELVHLADTYIFNKQNSGFTKNVNNGWKFAHGEYVAIVNSDTYLVSGNLYDLCLPGKVTSPEIINQGIPFLAGPFWVVPATVALEQGYLLEQMKTYSSDSEYDHRVRDIFQKVPSVRIYHEMAQTVKAAGIEGGEEQHRDRLIYQDLKEKGLAK